MEELTNNILISQPKLDLPVDTIWSDKGVIQSIDVICCHNKQPAFL